MSVVFQQTNDKLSIDVGLRFKSTLNCSSTAWVFSFSAQCLCNEYSGGYVGVNILRAGYQATFTFRKTKERCMCRYNQLSK